nr:hypothetical protein [Deltaproteobacteria bacterium]
MKRSSPFHSRVAAALKARASMRETSARVSGAPAGRDMRPTITATLTRSRTVPTASTRGSRDGVKSESSISSGSVTLA